MMPSMRWTWWSLLPLTACLSKPDAPIGLTVLAPDEAGAAELVLDGGDAFWTTVGSGGGATGAIRSCELEACVPRSLTSRELSPHSLLVEGDEVLWASGDSVHRVSRTATDAAPFIVGSVGAGLLEIPIAFRHIGARLFFSSSAFFFRCDYEPGGECASPSTISSLRDLTGPMTLHGNGLLWVANGRQLLGADVLAGQIKHTFPAPGLRSLIANTNHVFALDPDGTDLLDWPIAAPDGTPPTRIAAAVPLHALALDGDHLFVGTADGLLRLPLRPDPGPPEQIATGLPTIEAIAVAAERIYVIAAGRLGWLPKP